MDWSRDWIDLMVVPTRSRLTEIQEAEEVGVAQAGQMDSGDWTQVEVGAVPSVFDRTKIQQKKKAEEVLRVLPLVRRTPTYDVGTFVLSAGARTS